MIDIEIVDAPERLKVVFDDLKAGALFMRPENLRSVFMKFRVTGEGTSSHKERAAVRHMREALRENKNEPGSRFYIGMRDGIVYFDTCNFVVIPHVGNLTVHEKVD